MNPCRSDVTFLFVQHEETRVFFQAYPEFKLQCSGTPVNPGQPGCDQHHCSNGGTCLANFDNSAVFCVCPANYTGSSCETELPQCPQMTIDLLPSNARSAVWKGLTEGSLMTIFCAGGFTPDVFYSQCVRSVTSSTGAVWRHNGQCQRPVTAQRTTPRWQTDRPRTTRSYYYDDNNDDE